MIKHTIILTGGLAIAATVLPLSSGQPALATSTPRYVITDLGTLGGSFSASLGLNNHGDVTGISASPGDAALRGFLWHDGHLSDVGTLGGPQAGATDINNAGQFAGWSNTAASAPPSIFNQDSVFCTTPMAVGEPTFACHAFVSNHGTKTDLGTLGGLNSAAENKGINDLGHVVGVAETTTVDPTSPWGAPAFHAFLWRHGEMIDLGTLGDAPDSIAMAVNNRDQVVGVDLASSTAFENEVAWIWQDGSKVALGSLGGSFTQIGNLNDRGQVVGKSLLPGDATTHAFIWQRGRMTDLGTLPGDDFSSAADITNHDEIVGVSCSPQMCRPTLWADGKIVDLSAAIPPGTGWQLFDASAINARGQITGGGVINGEFHAFLMTPVH